MNKQDLEELEKLWKFFHKKNNSLWSGMSGLQLSELCEEMAEFRFQCQPVQDFTQGLVLLLKSSSEFTETQRSDLLGKLDGIVHSYLQLCRSLEEKV